MYVICMTGCYSCRWFESESAQMGCYPSNCCTACCVCLYVLRLDVPVVISRLGLLYASYDLFSQFSACFCKNLNNLLLILVGLLMIGLFKWKNAKTWSGRMAGESPGVRALLVRYMARKLAWHHRGTRWGFR